jgi:hypothetical protein
MSPVTDQELDRRLGAAGAALRADAPMVEPAALRRRAVRRRNRRMAAGATVAMLAVVAGVVWLPGAGDTSDVTPVSPAAPHGPGRLFATAAAGGSTRAFDVGGWTALAPSSWTVTEPGPVCGADVWVLAAAPPMLDPTTCTPVAGGPPALVVVSRSGPAPASTPTTTALAGDPSGLEVVAEGPVDGGWQEVSVVGSGPEADLLAASVTAPGVGNPEAGRVSEAVRDARPNPGEGPLPSYQPGVPDGAELTKLHGTSERAWFRLIDTNPPRARFITVCTTESADPGWCSGDPAVPLEDRTSVESAGVTWRCASPFACTSAGLLDVGGRRRVVTITVDRGLMTEAEVATILNWTARRSS